MVVSYLNTRWYPKQLRDLTTPCPAGVDPLDDPTRIICQRPYEPDGRAVYTANPSSVSEGTALEVESPVTPPTRSALAGLTDEDIDSIASRRMNAGPEGAAVSLGPIDATLFPNMDIQPWHRIALSVIANSWGDRPIYFASSGGASSTLGLDPYTIRHGLAFKLNAGLPQPDSTNAIRMMPTSAPATQVTGNWVDVERTEALLEEVFMHRGNIPDWSHWPDHSTVGIPNYYAWAYIALFQAAADAGDNAAVEKWRERYENWSVLGRAINNP